MENFEKIRKAALAAGLDGIMLLSEPNRQYASGFRSSDGMAVITGTGAWYFTDSRYLEAAGKQITGAKVLAPTGGKYAAAMEELVQKEHLQKLGFEEKYLSYSRYQTFAEQISAKLVPAEDVVLNLRASKSREELDVMIRAQRIAEKSFNELLPLISTDVTEKDLEAELVYRMLKNGAEDVSFNSIIVSGKKSSMPHGVPGDVKVQKGFLTMDFGVKYGGYCSDTTRTVCVGKPTEEMKTVYETVLNAQLAGIAAARAGVTGRAVDGAARKVIEDAGYGPCFGHSFGHSLGLEIHESPNASPSSDVPFPAGAVISAEPGIYLPGKFGVRIEDVLYLTESGAEDITKLPKDLVIL